MTTMSPNTPVGGKIDEHAKKTKAQEKAAKHHDHQHHQAHHQREEKYEAKQVKKADEARIEEHHNHFHHLGHKERQEHAKAHEEEKAAAAKTEAHHSHFHHLGHKERQEHAKEKLEEFEHKALEAKDDATKEAKKAARNLQNNSDNPVYIGNAVAIAALGALLGYGAYSKHSTGQLTWKLAGLWTGAVGLFGVADYYVSK